MGKVERILRSQVNWMRFLFQLHELLMINTSQANIKGIMGLRYVIIKQMLCQLNSLKMAVDGHENVFDIENWQRFISSKERTSTYSEVLLKYTNKYKRVTKEWN